MWVSGLCLGYGQALWFRVLFRSLRQFPRVKKSILMLVLRSGIRVIKRVKTRGRGYVMNFGFKGCVEVRH